MYNLDLWMCACYVYPASMTADRFFCVRDYMKNLSDSCYFWRSKYHQSPSSSEEHEKVRKRILYNNIIYNILYAVAAAMVAVDEKETMCPRHYSLK